MSTKDVVQVALAGEVDWSRFEQVVNEILRNHDFPDIRKLGGGADRGLDGVQEAFFDGARGAEIVVQVTSQKTQKLKVANTLAKLKKLERVPNRLVIVFRDECSATTRADIRTQAEKAGISVDVRDQSYLITELGREGSTIFERFFGSDIRRQVDLLVGRGDPLTDVPDQLKQSVLATFAAFGTSRERATLGRGKLFEQSVLTAIAVRDGSDLTQVRTSLVSLLPGVSPEESQLRAALTKLKEGRSIVEVAGVYRASDSTLSRIALAAKHVRAGFDSLVSCVTECVELHGRLNDAQRGALERNCRRALAHLVRIMGPLKQSFQTDKESHDWLVQMLGRDLSGAIGVSALLAMTDFVRDPENKSLIAPLIRAYSIVAIRNLDPLGKRWQANALRRSTIVLDTDAVLSLLVEQLPKHKAILASLADFKRSDVTIVVPDRVLSETVIHVENATRVYTRVGGDSLTRLSESTMVATVWNAVTRGFWHARAARASIAWDRYLESYLDPDDSVGFIRHILEKRLPGVAFSDLGELSAEDSVLLEQLTSGTLREREEHRLKSQFRDQEDLRERLSFDLRMILRLADSVKAGEGFGYLISEDGSFWIAEDSPGWKPRPRVAVRTRTLPELAELCCGTMLHDDELVNLMFEPALIAAGEIMKDEVEVLARIGADLHDVSLVALEWKLKKGLAQRIHAFTDAKSSGVEGDIENSVLDLLESAFNELDFDPIIKKVAKGFRALEQQSKSDRIQKEELQTSLRELLFAVAGDTSKGRTRARKALKQLGIEESDGEK